jgi:hypothetical protein
MCAGLGRWALISGWGFGVACVYCVQVYTRVSDLDTDMTFATWLAEARVV